MCAGVFTWQQQLSNKRILVHYDNESVVHMVNNQVSTCPQCMYLIHLLVLNNLKFNRRLFAKHLTTTQNYLADAISRGWYKRFFEKAQKSMNRYPDCISDTIWPASKIWEPKYPIVI